MGSSRQNTIVAAEISNYLILPLVLPATSKITYPAISDNDESTSTTRTDNNHKSKSSHKPASSTTSLPIYHYLYIQPHAPRLPQRDTPRSLYLLNIPIDATEAAVRALFAEQLGGWRVERVVFEDDDDFRRVGGLDNDGEEDDEENPQQGGGKLVRASSNDRQQQQQGRKRKRKRGRREDDQSNGLKVPGRPQLPALWDRKLHKSGSSAVVVFVDRQSAVSALRAVRSVRAKEKVKGQEERKIIWRPEKGLRVGVERYLHHAALSKPSHSTVQSAVDAHLSAFAAYEAAKAEQLARQRNEPDADGFITVTRGSGNVGRGHGAGPVKLEQAQQAAERLKARQERMAGGSFYRFQMREQKKERLKELRKGFQEDLRVVEDMRRKRGRLMPM